MALDRAVQLAREAGEVPPTLRLYTWVRPTVTLGRFQDATGVDRAACAEEGIDVVRRFTGGRGVLHDDELTYSIVAGLDDGVPRGTAASYRMLCGGLVEAYRELGVEAALTARPRGRWLLGGVLPARDCAPTSHSGRSSSRGPRRCGTATTVLQHGSFIVSRDVEREARVFGLTPAMRRRLADETVTISDAARVLGRRDGELVAAVVGAASSAVWEWRSNRGGSRRTRRRSARGLLGETDPVSLRQSRPCQNLKVDFTSRRTKAQLLRYNPLKPLLVGRRTAMSVNDDTTDALLDLENRSNEELREILDELYAEEQRVSYRRRVLHGKIDILRSELVRRLKAGREAGEDIISGRDVDRLIDILANDLRGVSRFDVTDSDGDFDLGDQPDVEE